MSSPERHDISGSTAVLPGDALYEIRNVQQIPGEATRRWYFSHEMDLIVWFDEQDRPLSFQLSYDKHRRIERTIRWSPRRGYSHHRVDDSLTGDEDVAPGPSGSALLVPDDAFDARKVRSKFLALSPAIPWAVTQYVADRLLAYREHRPRTIKATLAVAVLVALPLVIIACLAVSRESRRRQPD